MKVPFSPQFRINMILEPMMRPPSFPFQKAHGEGPFHLIVLISTAQLEALSYSIKLNLIQIKITIKLTYCAMSYKYAFNGSIPLSFI